MDQKGVRTQHPQYIAMAPRWKRARDASQGEAAVHAAGEDYLPKLAEEDAKDYIKRRDRTPFFNATWRTIVGLRGMLFRKDPEVEAPAGAKGYFDDVNMAGSPLRSFAQGVVCEALQIGRVGVLVDHPQQPAADGVTVAQAQRLGLRPTLQRYPAESIINWKTERIGNSTVLSMVVLAEDTAIDGVDEYAHTTEMRYRVLDLALGDGGGRIYRQRVFRIDAKGGDVLLTETVPLMNGSPLPFIPLAIIGVNSVGPDVEEPPLIDLIDMNLHHYSVSADYEHGCHFSGLPTLFISGYSPDVTSPGGGKIYIGGPTANCLPAPESKAYFVEIAGEFNALHTNLEDKKAQMAVLGARMLEVQRRGVESAETAAQHRKGEESQLSAMASTVSLAITRALDWFCDWAGASGDVRFELCREFLPVAMDAQELTALVGAWQSGAISGETLFDNLKRGEIIESDATYEEEQAKIANEGPKMGAAPIAPAPNAPVTRTSATIKATQAAEAASA